MEDEGSQRKTTPETAKFKHNHETNKELLYLINQSRNPLRAAQWRQLCQDFVNWPRKRIDCPPIRFSIYIRICTVSFCFLLCGLSSVYIIRSRPSRLITMRSALYNSITLAMLKSSFCFITFSCHRVLFLCRCYV